MSSLKLTDVDALYVGDDLVDRMFVGDLLVWNGDTVPELETSNDVYYDWTSYNEIAWPPAGSYTEDFSGTLAAWNTAPWGSTGGNTISGGQLTSGGAGFRDMMFLQDLGSPDQFCGVTAASNSGTSSIMLLARCNPSTAVHYAARFYPTDGEWQLYRYANISSSTQLATSASSPATAPYEVYFETETVGSDVQLRLYEVIAGVPVLRLSYLDLAIDTPVMAGNYAGIKVEFTGSAADNFYAGALP